LPVEVSSTISNSVRPTGSPLKITIKKSPSITSKSTTNTFLVESRGSVTVVVYQCLVEGLVPPPTADMIPSGDLVIVVPSGVKVLSTAFFKPVCNSMSRLFQ